jgi:hypothetical protein
MSDKIMCDVCEGTDWDDEEDDTNAVAAKACARCEDQGWVCEAHPEKAFDVDGKIGCKCGLGAGDPCPDCNVSLGKDDPPRLPPGFNPTDKMH